MGPIPSEIKVVVRGQSENETRLNLTAGQFSSVIDEPRSLGGTDAGPSPIQVLLMALAGCINVTGHVIAKEKGLQLNGMQITIEGVMNPAAFYGISNEDRVGFKQITVMVNPDFTQATEQDIEAWLKETEERCPVTDNIKSDTNITVKIQTTI
ncbi:MAG: OsmC family protein [Chloroflexi bacterium]|nr:OsmC family protein [Chloroflexota bacterium]